MLNNIRKDLAYIEKCSDRVVLLSSHTINDIRKIYSDYSPYKYCAIGNPIEYNCTENKVTKKKQILYVGRLEFQKRVDRLLNIWKNTDAEQIGWKLVIIGDGSSRPLFEQISKDYKLNNVEFVGTANPEEYYKKASILCITSSLEGLPMAFRSTPVQRNTYCIIHLKV